MIGILYLLQYNVSRFNSFKLWVLLVASSGSGILVLFFLLDDDVLIALSKSSGSDFLESLLDFLLEDEDLSLKSDLLVLPAPNARCPSQ